MDYTCWLKLVIRIMRGRREDEGEERGEEEGEEYERKKSCPQSMCTFRKKRSGEQK